jgi:hypothetical protein
VVSGRLDDSASGAVDVVVVADPGAVHGEIVLTELARRGVSALRYNLSDFRRNKLRAELGVLFLQIGDAWKTISNLTSVWWHRAGSIEIDDLDAEEASLAWDEATQLLPGMLSAAGVRWVDEPSAVERADTKPFQLHVVAELGVRVPRTLVTNDPNAARAFAGRHRVIAKATSPGFGIAPYVAEVPIADLEAVAGLPVLLQELVPALADVRVVVVGSQAWAWRRLRLHGVTDWRQTDPDGLAFQPIDDAFVLEPAIAITAALRLTMSVQDWLDTDEGPVFLESNAQGAWLFLRNSRETVAPALAQHLMARQ